MSNILEFPKHKIVRETPVDVEKLEEMKTRGVLKYADTVSEDVAHMLLQDIDNFGIDTTTPEFFKDFFFLTEVISATIYRSVGIEHPLHDFITENVRIESTEKPPAP